MSLAVNDPEYQFCAKSLFWTNLSPGVWVLDLHDDLHQPGPVGPADLPPHEHLRLSNYLRFLGFIHFYLCVYIGGDSQNYR